MLVACKKDGVTEQDLTEVIMDGDTVVVVEKNTLYQHSYEEQAGGTLLFSIEGKWGENQSWVLQNKEDAVAKVEELSQNTKAVKYRFSPQEKKGGYSEFEILLCDKETGKAAYSYVVSVVLSADGKTLSVLSVYYEEVVEEEDTEEETQELTEEEREKELQQQKWREQEQKEAQAAAKEFEQTIGKFSYPKEFTSLSTVVVTELVEEQEFIFGQVSFEYKERPYMYVVSQTLSLSDLQKAAGVIVEGYEPKLINKIEVQYYEVNNDRLIMWETADGYKYILIEYKMQDETGFEVAELLLKQ